MHFASTVVLMASRFCMWETIYLETLLKPRRSKLGGEHAVCSMHWITRGHVCYRTFLVIPELSDELSIWESEQSELVCCLLLLLLYYYYYYYNHTPITSPLRLCTTAKIQFSNVIALMDQSAS